MADNVYVGKGWETVFSNGGSVIDVSVNVGELLKLPKDKYGDVRIVLGKRKKPEENSKATHWAKVDKPYYERNGEKFDVKSSPKSTDEEIPF